MLSGRQVSILLLVCLLLSLSGCWSRREIETLGFVMAMGIDKAQEEGKLQLTMLVAKPFALGGGEKSNPQEAAVWIFSSTGDTVFEAIRNGNSQSPRRLFFAHNRWVLFGEELAREGISRLWIFGPGTERVDVRCTSPWRRARPPRRCFRRALSWNVSRQKEPGASSTTLPRRSRRWSPSVSTNFCSLWSRRVSAPSLPVLISFPDPKIRTCEARWSRRLSALRLASQGPQCSSGITSSVGSTSPKRGA